MKQSMILLHGLFGGLSNWTGVIKHFEDSYDIYVPELPLYEKHNDDTITNLVEFLSAMIDAEKLNNVILVGNSLGGHIAVRYSHQYPHIVDKLVLTGSSGLYENTQVGSYLKRGNYEYIHERVAATFYDPAIATDELVAEVLAVTTDTYKCLSIIKCAKATQRDKVLALLPEVSTPTLLIWGEEDHITPPEVAKQFRENLPNATLVMLPECGHAPMMEKPAAFNAALQEFIK